MKNPKPWDRVPRACEFIPKSDKLLDVGCGEGILAKFTKGKVKRLYGIDNDLDELKAAKKKGFITKAVDLDCEAFPFKTGSFNIVTCLDVIEHVRNPHLLLAQCYRVLANDGLLIISTPNIRFSDHIISLVIKGEFPKTSTDKSLYDGGHLHFFTYKDMNMLLKKAGFRRIENHEIINKKNRGWKGRLAESMLGRKMMLEFRTPGILVIASK